MKYANIIPLTYNEYLTYSVPKTLENKIKVGQKVIIPFGEKKTEGIVLEISDKPNFAVKNIISISGQENYLTNTQAKTVLWLSCYYFCSTYQALKNVMPEGLKIPTVKKESFKKKIMKYGKFVLLEENPYSAYEKISKKFLDKRKQVLILFPDKNRLNDFIIKKKCFLKSYNFTNLNLEKDKCKNNCRLFLGLRSAVFYPFSNISLIIIDREYENGYIQEKIPRYDTREVCEFIASEHKSNIIMHSEFLTLENYYKLKNGYKKIALLSPKKSNTKIDFMQEPILPIVGNKMEQEIKKTISQKKKVLVFINKKGEYSVSFCKDCENIQKCKNCNTPFVPKKGILFCKKCKDTKAAKRCSVCSGINLVNLGAGSEKIEKEIKSTFPKNKIIRIDSETKKTLTKRGTKNAEILVATAAIKSVEIENLGLVIIMYPENIINFPNYKNLSSIYNLFMTLLYKAGKDSLFLIKTAEQDHKIFKAIKKESDDFFEKELLSLKKHKYPPFYDLVKIETNKKDWHKIKKNIEKIKKNIESIDIIKKEDQDRKTVIIKSQKGKIFYDTISDSGKYTKITRNPKTI